MAVVLLVGGLRAGTLNAQDQPITRTELLRGDLSGVEDREVVTYIADLAPGAVGGKHTHAGDEFVYIIDGVLIVEAEGKEPVTLTSGEAAHLAQGVVHAARNGSEFDPAKVLVFIVLEKGKPLADPVN
ncbi:MAG: cupin domain-containing protein [Alphaproteobacteria bacterium]